MRKLNDENVCEYICQPNDCGYEPPECPGFSCGGCAQKDHICGKDGVCKYKSIPREKYLFEFILELILFFVILSLPLIVLL